MAIVKSVLFSELRGKIKHIEFRFRRNRKIELSMKRIPAYTRTDAQDKIRTRYGQLVQEWKQLSEEERKQYEAEARKYGISGWNYFVMVKMPVTGLEFDNGGGELWHRYINAAISSATAEDAVYIILFDDTNVAIQNVEGTEKISAAIASDFWSNVKDDGSDIRPFDQNRSQLYFFVESFDYASKTARIYVKLPAGSTELNIAYGNPSATKSDYESGEQVFEEFLDVNSVNEWTASNITVEASDGKIRFYGSSTSEIGLAEHSLNLSDYIMYAKFKSLNLGSTDQFAIVLCTDLDNRFGQGLYPKVDDQENWYYTENGDNYVGGTWNEGTEYVIRIDVLTSEGVVNYYVYDTDYNELSSATNKSYALGSPSGATTKIVCGDGGSSAVTDTYVEWFIFAKKADPADFSSMQIITL